MVCVLSAKRCGSTIIQNVTYYLIHKKQGRVKKYHSSNKILKNVKIIIPIRDPRNVALSFRRTILNDKLKKSKINPPINNLSFLSNTKLVTQLNIMESLYKKYKDDPNALILKYEDIFQNGLNDYNILIDKISAFLEINVSDELRREIHEELDFYKLKNISDKITTFKKNDMSTTKFGLHGQHISSDKLSYWEYEIPDNLKNEYNTKLKRFLNNLGYEFKQIQK